MAIDIEENPNNPEIQPVKKINIIHHFIIKYESDNIRRHFANLVNKLIKKHELKNFHVEEKPAYVESKIKYNLHTLTTNPNESFEKLDKIFIQRFDED